MRTLMMNWPGSVRGKYARPMKGIVTASSTATPPKIAAAVNPGRSIACMARPSYQSSSRWNLALNHRSNRAKTPPLDFSGCSSSSSPSVMNLAQKSGTTVIAKKYDAKIESTTPSAIGVKIYLLTPVKNVTGKNTIEVVKEI